MKEATSTWSGSRVIGAALMGVVCASAPAAIKPHALETIPKDGSEEKAIATMVKRIEFGVTKTAEAREKLIKEGKLPKTAPVAIRDAHAKHHGCVKGRFTVEEKLPEELRGGVFVEKASYPAWLRFSNGQGAIKNDREGDGRGGVVKLMDVPGEKIMESERDERTQDFLMINDPVFFVKDNADYLSFMTDRKTFFAGSTDPKNPKPAHPDEFRIVQRMSTITIQNPLETQYFSMVPIALDGKAMKVSMKPCDDMKFEHVTPGDDMLAEALKKQLEKGTACLQFMVQLQGPAADYPVEDPTKQWVENKAIPRTMFRKVATITMQKQVPVTGDFCEDLSFTPWHALPAHQPLGGIQRARLPIYDKISEVRHRLNKAKRVEPRPVGTF